MTRKKQPASIPDALPARFSLNPQAFDGMTIAILKLPYGLALWRFEKWLEDHFERVSPPRYDEKGQEISPKAPYRLLNNALTACAPTIVHGFEWYYNRKDDKGFRMLAIGKSIVDEQGNQIGSTLSYPSEEEIARVMRSWLTEWGERSWLKNLIEGPGKEPWRNLQAELNRPPDTIWQHQSSLRSLIETPDGFSFDAVPSLVATLLHETTSFIGPNRTRVQWRRMQGGSKNRYCLVSQPLPVEFLKRDLRTSIDKQKRGFFSYKVEIELQTQAGRNQPWLYLSLHCMRYAHYPLAFNKRGSDVTVLVAANLARLRNWKTDTTLVRLKATPNTQVKNRDQVAWLENLPSLLARLEARPLEMPGELYSNPHRFWRTDEAKPTSDEYYILHTEGYSYREEGKGSSKHPVLTGFSLGERAEVLGSLCEGVLKGSITHDIPLRPDAVLFTDDDKPMVLSNIIDLIPKIPLMSSDKAEKDNISGTERYELREEEERQLRNKNHPIIAQALKRATNGRQLIIAIFYREAETLDVLTNTLRDSLLLNEEDLYPEQITILEVFIPEQNMIQPLEEVDNQRRTEAEILAWREIRLQQWQKLLQETFNKDLTNNDVICSAIIELDKSTHTERNALKITPDRRSIRSVIRESCARLNVLSQMIVTPAHLTGIPKRDSATKGKALQTVQEIVTRQIGSLYDIPAPLYEAIGLDSFGRKISDNLDVIALSFCTTQTGVRYCLATRLSKDGKFDVLLPEPEADWMPYSQAGLELARIFATARKDVVKGKIGDGSKASSYKQSKARLKQDQINGFLESILTKKLERPTIVILDAEKWRSTRENGGGWWQIQNNHLSDFSDRLIFGYQSKTEEQSIYYRLDQPGAEQTSLHHLLGVIRLRTHEMPQYITKQQDWQFDDAILMRNYFELAGFVDRTENPLFHYYSIGKLPAGAGKPQHKPTLRDPLKIVSGKNSGGGVAYRHPGMIEMVPFFVHPDFNNNEGMTALCRVPHYLRSSPAWAMGNLDSPYPLHLGDVLIDDQICILGLGNS